MKNRASKYMRFVLEGKTPSGKTNVWQVLSNGIRVGFIRWNGAWRCYVFYGLNGTYFDKDGLDLIADFLHSENRQHRIRR